MALSVDPNDPRWMLVHQVVASALFEKSPRLRAFLLYVAEMELTGQRHEINEQHIGIQVFGRPGNYNPGDDSIVRSQARFLRQRLQEYFSTLGASSPLVIEIPKGNYVPVFEKREAPTATPPAQAALPEPAGESGAHRLLSHRNVVLLSVVLLACAAAALYFFWPRHAASDRFWSTLFSPHRTQLIVPSDSTLILIEELTGEEVPFTSYVNREYLTKDHLEKAAPNTENADLENSHYTSMADLRMVASLSHLKHFDRQHIQIRYARELSISDAREDNLILIGGTRANPWVTLFAPQMNFGVDYDWTHHQNRVINKSPRSGEQPFYAESPKLADRSVYGLVAYEPSLDHQGYVLLVAGTSSAGTQAAADFLLNDSLFDAFLKRIQRTDGSIPNFELLLESHSLNGNATGSSILAYRISAGA